MTVIRRVVTSSVAALCLASGAIPSTGGGSAQASPPARASAADSGSESPFHYAQGDHLKPGQWEPRQGIYGGGNGRIVYLVGDSMAGQLADPTLAVAKRQGRRLAPRTKSGTSFAYPDSTDTEAGKWRRAVYTELEGMAATQRVKPVVVVAGQRPGTTTTLRRTVWHLRKAGLSVRLATSSPQPSTSRPGARFQVVNPGPGRWATKQVAGAVRVPTLDIKPVAARSAGGGWHAGSVKGAPVYRNAGSHLSVASPRRCSRGTWTACSNHGTSPISSSGPHPVQSFLVADAFGGGRP